MKWSTVLAAPVRALVWTLDLCDAKGSPSLSKGIAAAVALVALRDAWLYRVSALNVSAMALGASIAFGRSMFMNWLGRHTWSNHGSVALTGDAAKAIDAIAKARDHDRGVDPA